MKNIFTKITWLVLLIGLAACSPTIDSSSEQSFEQSLEKVSQSLEGKEKKDFEDAVGVVMLGLGFMNKDKGEQVLEKLDGMSASDFVAYVRANIR